MLGYTYTVLCYTILYYNILYHTILYYYYMLLYYTTALLMFLWLGTHGTSGDAGASLVPSLNSTSLIPTSTILIPVVPFDPSLARNSKMPQHPKVLHVFPRNHVSSSIKLHHILSLSLYIYIYLSLSLSLHIYIYIHIRKSMDLDSGTEWIPGIVLGGPQQAQRDVSHND